MRGSARDKARGALLGAACGDAIGAAFEGARVVSPGSLAARERGGEPLGYTDDTAMTVVLAEHLVEALRSGDVEAGFDEDRLVRAFAVGWRAEPWRGYGAGPPRVFRRLLAGGSWRAEARALYGGGGSLGNGGAMRVAPVGLVASDLGVVARLARRSASVTHVHPLGQEGAAAQAVAVALARVSNPARPLDRDAFLGRLRAHLTQPAYSETLERVRAAFGMSRAAAFEAAREIGVGVPATESVPAALLAFLRQPDDPAAAINFAVRLGGDTDTIAAMAGGVVGARCGEGGLRAGWLRRLEGAPRLRELADALADGSARPPTPH